jgi:manganese oxidase
MPLLHPAARATLLGAAFAFSLPARDARSTDDLPTVEPNDNRTPAGRLVAGERTVILEARTGVWQPNGPDGPRLTVAAFAEPGGALQTPGPIIRVASGTVVRAIVRNRLDVPLFVYGLGPKRGLSGDSVEVAPGAERELRFTADVQGTYFYQARTEMVMQGLPHLTHDSQLHGAIVVDPKGARANDRVFVISEYFTLDTTTMSGLGPNPTLSFNGRGWPHTEPLDATQGDTIRWRIVNVTGLEHPLHLHGFYYSVEARGDAARDTVYAPGARRRVVTEVMLPFTTMAMRWVPVRSGNWIFHCHFASHITHPSRFEMDRRMPTGPVSTHDHGQDHGQDHGLVRTASLASAPVLPAPDRAAAPDPMAGHHMAGLVLGVRVRPRGAAPDYGPVKRSLSLEIRSKASVYGDAVGYAYVLAGSPDARDAAAMPLPGPTLVLTKGERVAITIVNRSHEPAAVHWHGIELESFPDGVPGFSGTDPHLLPMVAPGDSLTVRFTPPRAGTFMYHSHSNELQQISSGLYGAIVVADPAVPRDTSRERMLLFSDEGPQVNLIQGPVPPTLLNGKREPAPIELVAGVTYRLRLINIRGDVFTDLALLDGDRPLTWRTVAVDGADLPASMVKAEPSTLLFAPGMIRDVEFTPVKAGRLTLRYENGRMPPPLRNRVTTEIVVR